MIKAILKFELARESSSGIQHDYEQTHQIVMALKSAAPDICPDASGWFGGVMEPKQKTVSFAKRDELLGRLSARMKKDGDDTFFLQLSTKPVGKYIPGELGLLFMPSLGYLTVSIYWPDKSGVSSTIVARMLDSLVSILPVTFAFVDVFDREPNAHDPSDITSYAVMFATFRHRQCLGWMAYVPHVVTQDQLPLAAEVLPAKAGSIVISTHDYFDIANTQHIKRANQIEMDMVDLGLLVVTDPSL